MGKTVVAVDTNVIFSAMIRDGGVSRAFLLLPIIHPNLEFVISDAILEELNQHSGEIARKAGLLFALFRAGLNKLLSNVKIVSIKGKFEKEYLMKFVVDRGDAHVVALALSSGAEHIITYNKKHFKRMSLSPRG